MYKFASTLLFYLTRLFRLLSVKGKENIPEKERYIITCSHKGWVDVIMLALSIYPTSVYYMAKKELFDTKLKDKFFRSINAFPVNRENPGPSSLKIPLQLLKQNKCVGIFPSGTRTNEEVSLKRGAVTIAIKSNAPLVPAAYKGPTNFKELISGRRSTIILGKPLNFEEQKQVLGKDELIEYALKTLETEIKKLEENL
ncbi:1-acyl-sn-glycerol-3-phosphate acyltransferase [Priestia aryabhattai]|uniref:lysophospholipid acyltransferase family protein n=1 Tax=Priestia aryabhattai TaxID=412384 RepID=UPI00288206F1|nr:1-acyl-sn-glycerol-3-phosphate acyltransferase [Priestia aryabhattai]MDT0150171.1 1-acyl-sn-glycerol-3-phosphate acyltransferase [Priestia aryabhattai]MDT0155759.1 1-acyl-sn-glycerol-3-phosphate acyltransferase [Priestia aryabhattai]